MNTSGILSTGKYLLLIIVIFIAACIETDIYLPAFPDMMQFFKASEDQIQSLLTWNFVGICVSGPFYGPISDSFGRRVPLLVALGLFLLGSLITLFAQSFDQMLLGRLLQGLGSGGCFTLGTAIIFDVFQAEKAIQALNQLNLIIPFLMALAPMLGGFLNYHLGFRSNFFAIAFFVLISFAIAIFFFKETLPKERQSSLQMKKIFKDFGRVLTCIPLWEITLIVSFMFAGYLVFLSGTAVLFVVEFGMSKSIFPFFQASLLISWLIASLVFKRAMVKFGAQKLKQSAVLLIFISGIELVAATFFSPQNPYLLTFGMLLYTFGCNWIIGLYFPEGMEFLPDIKGVTASFLTSARLLFTALVVGLSSLLYNGTIYPISGIILGILCIILPIILLYEKTRPEIAKTEPFTAANH